MSLLSIVQGAAIRCQIAAPPSAIGSSLPDVQRLVAFAQDTGDELVERWTWKNLIRAGTFIADGSISLFKLPSDFGTLSPSDKFVSNAYPLGYLPGPVNAEALLLAKEYPITVLPPWWRAIQDYIEFYPTPAAGTIINYTYASKFWITAGTTVEFNDDFQQAQEFWTADTNASLIPERLIRLGTIWRFKQSNGLDYGEDFRVYEASLDRLAGQENTERTISTSRWLNTGDADVAWPGIVTVSTS